MKVFLIFLFSISIYAGEVDFIYASDKDIKDSKDCVNKYLNDAIKKVLVDFSLETTLCENAALHIMQEIGATDYFFVKIGALNSSLEIWANENHQLDRSPTYGYENEKYMRESIYAPQLKVLYFYPKNLDATINLDGVYLGIDKLSHFVGSGYEYYKRFLEANKKGFSEKHSEIQAIKWGVAMEKGILGLWSVGIFSYADLEVNYQGLKMAQDLCRKKIIEYKNKKWHLRKKIKIEDYVNPYWDELYYPNSYTKGREINIRKNIDTLHICQNLNWDKYANRMLFYQNRTRTKSSNLSRELLNGLSQNIRQINLENLCRKYKK